MDGNVGWIRSAGRNGRGLGGADSLCPPLGCHRSVLPGCRAVCVHGHDLALYVLLARFTDVSANKQSACHAGDVGSIPESGSSPGGGHGNPLQYSCLENSMDRGAWQATVHGVVKSWT